MVFFCRYFTFVLMKFSEKSEKKNGEVSDLTLETHRGDPCPISIHFIINLTAVVNRRQGVYS